MLEKQISEDDPAVAAEDLEEPDEEREELPFPPPPPRG
jgi:hypothetical protein